MTSGPTTSTTPAMSVPGTACRGPRNPKMPGAMRRAIRGSPRITCQSRALTDEARTRTSTSSPTGAGIGTRPTDSRAGDPYRRWMTARMVAS